MGSSEGPPRGAWPSETHPKPCLPSCGAVCPSVYRSVRPSSQLPATIWAEPLWPEQGPEWGMAATGRLGASLCSSHCRGIISRPQTAGVTTVLLGSVCGSGLQTGHSGESSSLRHLGPQISEASSLTCLAGTRLPAWASARLWREGRRVSSLGLGSSQYGGLRGWVSSREAQGWGRAYAN